MKNLRLLGCVALFAVAVVLFAHASADACPGCKDALASGADGDGTPQDGFGYAAQAFSICVLFMLGVLSLVVTGFGFAAYRLTRRPVPAVPTDGPPASSQEPPLP
jgi:hypothetical protein